MYFGKPICCWCSLTVLAIWTLLGLGIDKRVTAENFRSQPPNVVLILVDDLGWMDLGCQGSDYFKTPNIDALAASGIRFTDAYAACAVCSPTRAAVMTGKSPARTGITDWIRARFQRGNLGTPDQNPTDYVGGSKRKLLCPPNPYWMEHEEETVAELLKARGYQSCHIGKWHLGDPAWYPTAQGFDRNIAGCDLGQPPSYFDPYFHRRYNFDGQLTPRSEGEYLTYREADEAQNFIAEHHDKPFFLFYCPYAVHTPIQAIDDVTEKYRREGKTEVKAKYAAMIESVDDAVGTITDALDAHGLTGHTLIIFTSDNGGLVGPTDNKPLRSGKGYAYEGGIRVPLIVKWPGVVMPGSVSSVPVTSVDLFPTIADATGTSSQNTDLLDGHSLVPILRDPSTGPTPRSLYWHFPHYRHAPGPYGIVRDGNWKLIRWYEGGHELYHLKDDLGETTNLASELPDRVRLMQAKLDAELFRVGAKEPRVNPAFQAE